MVPTGCSAYYTAMDQRSKKVQEGPKGLRTVIAPSQLTTESHPLWLIVLGLENHVDVGRHRRCVGVGQLRAVQRYNPGWMIGSADSTRTYYKNYVLEVKVTWRMIERNDDWGPWSLMEEMIGDPRMIVVTAAEMQVIAGVATRTVVQQAS